jgi:uncharacterized protein YacL
MLFTILIFNIVMLLGLTYLIWRDLPRTYKRAPSVILDTSALMDGRIIELVRLGFVPAELSIPRFVIAELQLLADKSDHLKRERARFGLQTVQELQAVSGVTTRIITQDISGIDGVDDKLVRLAIKRKAMLFTTDYNLLKVAEIEGVRVLNINQLTQNLRPTHLPGEITKIKIVQKGQERNQGVGYLEDGTMVVVENTAKLMGKDVQVEFTRNLQTAAGRMMFASLKSKTTK